MLGVLTSVHFLRNYYNWKEVVLWKEFMEFLIALIVILVLIDKITGSRKKG